MVPSSNCTCGLWLVCHMNVSDLLFFSRQKKLLPTVVKTAKKITFTKGSSNERTWTPLQNRNNVFKKIAKNKMPYQEYQKC